APAQPTHIPWQWRHMLSRAVARPPALWDNRGWPARNFTSTGKRFETAIKCPSSSFIFLLHRRKANPAESSRAHRADATKHRPDLAEVQSAPIQLIPVL